MHPLVIRNPTCSSQREASHAAMRRSSINDAIKLIPVWLPYNYRLISVVWKWSRDSLPSMNRASGRLSGPEARCCLSPKMTLRISEIVGRFNFTDHGSGLGWNIGWTAAGGKINSSSKCPSHRSSCFPLLKISASSCSLTVLLMVDLQHGWAEITFVRYQNRWRFPSLQLLRSTKLPDLWGTALCLISEFSSNWVTLAIDSDFSSVLW